MDIEIPLEKMTTEEKLRAGHGLCKLSFFQYPGCSIEKFFWHEVKV